jgi:transcription elongation factor Elf1
MSGHRVAQRATYPHVVALTLESVITCPLCGTQAAETMPENACWYFYRCEGCGQDLRPREGDCCVFCSYGTVTCPPKQSEASEHDDACCG